MVYSMGSPFTSSQDKAFPTSAGTVVVGADRGISALGIHYTRAAVVQTSHVAVPLQPRHSAVRHASDLCFALTGPTRFGHKFVAPIPTYFPDPAAGADNPHSRGTFFL